MTTSSSTTSTVKLKTKADFAKKFASAASTGKSAKYVVRLIAAIQAKILHDRTTLSVARQTMRHGLRLIANAKRVNDLDAVDSLSQFLDNAFNIKAFDYCAILADANMNDYLAITLEHLKGNESTSRSGVKAALAHYYGKGTVDAQSSMTITALRALRAIEGSSGPDSPITRDVNFDQVVANMGNYQIARPVIN